MDLSCCTLVSSDKEVDICQGTPVPSQTHRRIIILPHDCQHVHKPHKRPHTTTQTTYTHTIPPKHTHHITHTHTYPHTPHTSHTIHTYTPHLYHTHSHTHPTYIPLTHIPLTQATHIDIHTHLVLPRSMTPSEEQELSILRC